MPRNTKGAIAFLALTIGFPCLYPLDDQLLRLDLELTDLTALGADLAALGFTAEELAKALNPAGTAGLIDENEVPELPEKAVTAVGDIWLAGSHRIACGDSYRRRCGHRAAWWSRHPNSWSPIRPMGSTTIRLGVIA